MMRDCLAIKNLSKHYKGFSLDNISFSLPTGCLMGLIGENGAGKSTTINLILNLIQRDSGEITVFGKDNRRDEREIKEQIGVVFDACCFPVALNADEIGRVLSGIYRSWDDAAYQRYLGRFSVDRKKKIKDYSSGMKTKLSIAAALSHNPRLLLLDEATSGLDPISRNEMLDIFQEFIQDEEHSVLLSSHITSDLDRVADYVTFLHGGKVLICEEKDKLRYNYVLARCGQEQLATIPREIVVSVRRGQFGSEALVKDRTALARSCPDIVADRADLETIMYYTIKGERL